MVMCRYGSLGACIESLCTEEADFDASTRFEALDFAAIIEQVGMTQKEGRRLFRILDTQRVGVVALEDLALAVAGKLPRRRSSVGSPRPHPRRRASASPSVDSGRKGSAGTMAQPSTAVPTVKNPVVQCKVNPPSVPMAPQSGTSEIYLVMNPQGKYCGSIVDAEDWPKHLRHEHHTRRVAAHYRAEQRESVRKYPDGQFLMDSNYIEIGQDNYFRCTLCNKKAYGFDMIIESHCTSDKHKRAVEWAARSSPPPTDRRFGRDATPGDSSNEEGEFMRAQRLKKDEEGWIVCTLCNKKFFEIESAKSHCISNKHVENVKWDDDNRRLYSPELGKLTADGHDFVQSNYLEMNGTMFSCPLCDKQFYDIGETRVHCDAKAHIKAVKWKNSDNTEKTDDPDYNAAYKKQFYRTEDGQEVATVAGVIGSGEDDAPCNYPNELVNQGYLRCETCDTNLLSWDRWKEHLNSKKHLRRRAALDEEYVCYWQKLHAGGVDYYYEHLSQIWQWGAVPDGRMRVKFCECL
ncbi:hypothetical protein Pmar_PMAR017631 [Perkinsus marinus ATCC 50983]|uniref:C2H2-type domain-containing protein n=1 Tax=Perkinsus marinus (strain ATCC 50983 / TXsc) TaxID=423536 RepID=C5L3J8_PERM5|nr:hypothetical protein Pmar_PMAR017631 [Perkinsus marinus ATCC 50983]EER08577.1 hypothetical protein Pmar_PMAR017631 [Perkinsus marinus ATCC 50983]|eukprot:XP_002776761.1 hypothetical protein Pmar_PMAR017631 [Perkinsus marinus ATCC 50983]